MDIFKKIKTNKVVSILMIGALILLSFRTGLKVNGATITTKEEVYDGTLSSVVNANGSTLAFYNYSGYGWTGGIDSGRKVAMVNGLFEGATASFMTMVEGPLKITFDWQKLYNVNSNAKLFLLVDGIPKMELSEKNQWITSSIEIPSGYHTVEWSYKMLTLDSAYRTYNSAFVDNINAEKPAYKITFDENIEIINGKTSFLDLYKTTEPIKLPTPPVRFGYMFLGWNTKRDGTGTAINDETVISSTQTVYAQWITLESLIPTTATDTIFVRPGLTNRVKLSSTDYLLVTYSSENEKIATVDSNGEITGVSIGSTKITTTLKSKYGVNTILYTNVTVRPSLKISVSTVKLNINESSTLKILETTESVKWESDDQSVATVSDLGVVKGISEGNATITAVVEEQEFSTEIIVSKTIVEESDVTDSKTPITLTKKQKINKAYMSFLTSKKGKTYDPKFISFIDIDNNGTTELIISDTEQFSGEYSTIWNIFTYTGGSVKYIGKIKANGLSYSKSKKVILADTGLSYKGVTEKTYKISKNKVVLIHTFYEPYSGTKKIDGKNISSAKYKKKYNKYVDSKTKQITFTEYEE